MVSRRETCTSQTGFSPRSEKPVTDCVTGFSPVEKPVRLVSRLARNQSVTGFSREKPVRLVSRKRDGRNY
nr:hypothetical protein Itr_chr12CG10520 [Ipomoea trifida]